MKKSGMGRIQRSILSTKLLFSLFSITFFLLPVRNGSAASDSNLRTRKNIKQTIQQEKTITGKVTDECGEPLPGVAIQLKGTSTGTVTNAKGEYSISSISEEATLMFSFVGMKTKEVPVAGRTSINVVLELASIGLDEVVAVGYGTMKKSDLTGSVASVSSDQIIQTLPSTIEQSLSGRVSGVQVTQSEGAPGAGVKIRIRGNTSINASNEPLYVIDGFPVESGGINTSIGGSGLTQTSVLATLNPNDIESIEILKDASATAIYGSRGANGVILITTKSGGENRKNINFSANYGVSKLAKKLDVLSGNDYIDYFNDAYLGYHSGNAPLDYAIRDENGAPILDYLTNNGDSIWKFGTADMFLQHDWQDEVFRSATLQDYSLSFSGGTTSLDYLASIGYFSQEGIVTGSQYERFTGNFKLINNFTDKFQVAANINTGYSINEGILSATSDHQRSSGVINNTILFRPVYGYDYLGNQITTLMVDQESYEITNPLLLASEQDNHTRSYNLRSSFNMSYEFLEGLKLEIKAGATLDFNKQRSWYPKDFGFGRTVGGGVALIHGRSSIGWLNDNLLTYQKTLKNHRINIVTGFTQQTMNFEDFGVAKYNFDIQSINVDNIDSGTDFYVGGNNSNANSWSLRSWIWRASYAYKDKYIFTLTGRGDGSSKFPMGKKWAFFPSGGVAWRASEEQFMQSVSIINNLKLHASYGVSGNQAIPPYASQDTYSFSTYIFGNKIATGLGPTRLENRGLSWETTTQLDVGMDISLFDNRISLNAVYYEKLTEDLLIEASVPFTTGYSEAWKNSGAITNTGFEFALNTINLELNDFTWRSTFNISFNKNMIKSLDTGTELDYVILDGPAGAVNMCYIIQEGKPVGSMYGLIWDGIYQLDDFTYDETKSHLELINTDGYEPKEGVLTFEGNKRDPGDLKFKDIAGGFDENGNPIPDGNVNQADRTIIGDANPKHFGGFASEFIYKNFDLSFLMNWSYGNDILNQNLALGMSLAGPYRNQYAKALERWTPDNPTDELYAIAGGNGGLSNSFYIEDGSFLRLSNVTFGYNLPKSFLQRWKISNAHIYVSGDNLHTWTNYSGYDPEVSIGSNALTPGTDFSAYPRSRTIRLGVKLSL